MLDRLRAVSAFLTAASATSSSKTAETKTARAFAKLDKLPDCQVLKAGLAAVLQGLTDKRTAKEQAAKVQQHEIYMYSATYAAALHAMVHQGYINEASICNKKCLLQCIPLKAVLV